MFEESAYHVFVTISQVNKSKAVEVAPGPIGQRQRRSLAAQQNPDGSLRPLNPSFAKRSPVLNDPQGMLRNGLIGTARIEVEEDRETVAWRVWRYIKPDIKARAVTRAFSPRRKNHKGSAKSFIGHLGLLLAPCDFARGK